MAFRRLAWHRSKFVIGFGLFLSLWSVPGVYLAFYENPNPELCILAILAELIVLRIIVRGFTGSLSKRQLRVDVPAGVLQLENLAIVPLDDVGELSITKRGGSQRRVLWYELRAAGIPGVLYESPYDTDTQKRFDALRDAVLQSKLRRVLERPVEGAAFRAAPDQLPEILEIADTRERAASALAALGSDHDAAVASRAKQLLASLA